MPMTEEHKAVLARGRRESRAIKAYLQALMSKQPGRPVTVESMRQRIATLDKRLNHEEDPLKRVELIQARLDAKHQLAEIEDAPNLEDLEAKFVEVAKAYSERKGISYLAWREAGVPASTLKEAGLPRTRRS